MARETPKQPPSAANSRHLGHGRKADAVREQAILALLEARTIAEAAHRCGVGERTLQRWLAEDHDFRQELETARRVTFQAALHRVQALMTQAANALEDLLRAKQEPTVRLGAAKTVAELALHLHNGETILRKLHEIEQVQRSRPP